MKIASKDFRIYLETLTKEDAADFAREINDPDILSKVSNPGYPMRYPYSKEQAIDFIGRLGDAHLQGRMISFAIRERKTKEFVGSVGLGEIDHATRSCEILFWLGKRHQGRGFAKEAVGLVVHYAFSTLGMERINALIYSENERSVGLLKGIGFAEGGKHGENPGISMVVLLKGHYNDTMDIHAGQ